MSCYFLQMESSERSHWNKCATKWRFLVFQFNPFTSNQRDTGEKKRPFERDPPLCHPWLGMGCLCKQGSQGCWSAFVTTCCAHKPSTALVTLTHSLWDTDRQISFIYYTFGRDTCATLSLHPNFNMELRVLTRAFFPDGNLPELSSRQLFFQRGSISFKLTTKRCERVPASCLFIYFLPPPIAFQMTYFCFPLETNWHIRNSL